MKKNEIYINMLSLSLPYIRNVQTWSEREKGRNVSCYFEADLVHNLTHTLLIPEFTDHDIWFLNYQAKSYFENCNDEISPNYSQQIEYIKRLFAMVPETLKPQLLWVGPY